MIETQINSRIRDAQNLAHQERAEAFSRLFRIVPNVVSSLRHRR